MLLVVAAVAAVLLVLLVGAALWLLGHLEAGPVKGRVHALSEEHLGVRADYDALSVSVLSGLHLEGLRIPTPAPFAERAPTLLSIGALDVRWELASAWSERIVVPEIVLRDLEVVLVSDASGASSVGALLERLKTEPPPPEEPAKPLSTALDLSALPRAISLGRLTVEGTSATLIQTEGGTERRRIEVGGVALGASADLEPSGGTAELSVRHAKEGLRLALTEGGQTRELVVSLDQTVELHAPQRVGLKLVLDVVRQTLDPRLSPVRRAAELDATARFGDGTTTLELGALKLLDEAVVTSGVVDLPDAVDGALRPRVRELTLAARIDPVAEALGELVGITLKDGQLDASLTDAGLAASGEVEVGGKVAVAARLAELGWRPPAGKEGPVVAVVGGSLDIEATGVRVAPSAPEQARGAVRASVAADELEVGSAAFLVDGDGIQLGVSGELTGSPPYAAELTTKARRLRLVGAGAKQLLGGVPVRLSVQATGVVPAHKAPATSRGRIRADVALGPLTLKADVTKHAAAAEFDVTTQADALGPLASLVPSEVRRAARVPWSRLGLSLATRGRVRNLDRPARLHLEHETTLRLSRLALARAGLDVRVAALSLQATSKGGTRAHAGKLTLRMDKPRINGFSSDARLALEAGADIDLRRPRARLDLKLGSPRGPDVTLGLRADFDPKSRRITHDLAVAVARLADLAPLLPPEVRAAHRLDWSRLAVNIVSKGELGGVVRRFAGGTRPILVDDPLAALDGEQTLTLAVQGLDYQGQGQAVRLDALDLAARAKAVDGAVEGGLDLTLPAITAEAAGKHFDLKGLTQHLELTADRLPDPSRLGVSVRAEVAAATQDALKGYEIGDLRLEGALRVHELASLRLDRLELVNRAGGTKVQLRGVVETSDGGGLKGAVDAPDRVPGQQAVAFDGYVDQRLDALNGLSTAFEAGGRLRMPMRVESGDGHRFRVRATLQPAGVDLKLPEQEVYLSGLDGSIQVAQEVDYVDGGVQLVPGARRNAYAWSRFQDVQPFLGTASFVAAKQLLVRGVQLGPMAGNLGVDRNLIGIDQLQLGLLGGTVTGQLMADLTEGDRTILFRGNVTGLRPTEGDEVLDANAALTLQPDRLVLDGRMQVVRIGRNHLLDLMDLLDPYREDVNMNRARKALLVGYPKSVRLRFDHGFMSLKLELAGLASLVSLEEVRGVPLGPLLERFVGPVLGSVGMR